MQFRILHLLVFLTGLAGVLAIREVGQIDIFRQTLALFGTLVLAWVTCSLALSNKSKWTWVFGSVSGVLVAATVSAVTMLTWPAMVNCDINGEPFMPFEFYLREIALFVVICPIIGAAVGGWLIAASQPELKARFAIPVRFSKLVLGAAIVFRLLTLVGEMRPDWETLALFGILVFSIHTWNWMPRLLQADGA